jgi:hypothetical protein
MLDIAPKAGSRETQPGRLLLLCLVGSTNFLARSLRHMRGLLQVTVQEFDKIRLPEFSLVLPLSHSLNNSLLCPEFI